MTVPVLQQLFSLLRDHWSRTRGPAPRNFVHPEPEPSQGDPRMRLQRRNGTRSDLGVWCRYAISELVGVELDVVHAGHAVVVDIVPAGILMFVMCARMSIQDVAMT